MYLSHDDEMVVVHIDDGNGTAGMKVPVPDHRANKPIGFHDKQDGKTAFLQRLIKAKTGKSEISLAAPNEISLALNISKKATEKSDKLRKEINPKSNKPKKILYESDVAVAYDYLEEIQKAIVFSYKAVESFCNATIPNDYIYRKTTSKGIEESYGKEQIERWISTSEKISEILPNVIKATSPAKEKFWSDFKNLERIRNEVVHSKSTSSTEILQELFLPKIRDYILSSLELLHFFIKEDYSNPIFPLGFGDSKIKVISVDNVDEILKPND